MATHIIARDQWQPYFDRVSRTLEANDVDIEIDGLDLGAQVEVDHLPLQGLSYDPKDDAFSIVLENLEHRITRPQAIYVDEEADRLASIEVVDQDERKHIARLTRALMLPKAD